AKPRGPYTARLARRAALASPRHFAPPWWGKPHPTHGRYILLTSPRAQRVLNMDTQKNSISRRQFIRTTSAAAVASTALSSMAIAGASEKVIVGIMRASPNRHGSQLASGFAGQNKARVAYRGCGAVRTW